MGIAARIRAWYSFVTVQGVGRRFLSCTSVDIALSSLSAQRPPGEQCMEPCIAVVGTTDLCGLDGAANLLLRHVQITGNNSSFDTMILHATFHVSKPDRHSAEVNA